MHSYRTFILAVACLTALCHQSGAQPLVLQQFEGINARGAGAAYRVSQPPDTHGAAGPAGILASVNLHLAYFSKDPFAGQNRLPLWNSTLAAFWSANPGFSSSGMADTKVSYEALADGRFFVIMQETTTNQSFLNIAVSKSPDPSSATTNDWFFYRWEMTWVDPARFGNSVAGGDYPGIAVDERALYVSYNMFLLNGAGRFSAFAGATELLVFNSSALRNGILPEPQLYREDAFSSSLFNNGINSTIQPAQMGRSLDGGADPLFAVNLREIDSPLGNQYKIRLHRLNGMLSSLTHASDDLDVDTVGADPGPAPQPGGFRPLDTVAPRCMGASYDAGDVWMTWAQKSETSGQAVVRWARVHAYSGACCPTTPKLLEDGWVDAGTSTWNYIPALGVNRQGDVCLIFTQSSPTQNPSIYYMLRRAGTAAFAGPILLKSSPSPGNLTGRASQNFARWGDYATVAPDPGDSTFWVAHQFVNSTNQDDTSTWWAQIAPCDPQVTVTQHPASQLACLGFPMTLTAGYTSTLGYTPNRRWYRNGIPVPAMDNRETLVIFDFQPSSAGRYWYEVEGACGTRVRSSEAVVQAIDKPSITLQPKDFQTCPDANASIILEVAAHSPLNIPMSFQWYRNAEIVPDATNSVFFALPVLDKSLAGNYFCRVANICGYVDSTSVSVEIGPRVTLDPIAPTNPIICTVPLELTVRGVGVTPFLSDALWLFNNGSRVVYRKHSLTSNLEFTWRHNGLEIVSNAHFVVESSGLESRLRILNPDYDDDGDYDCTISDGCAAGCAVTSKPAFVLLQPTPQYVTVVTNGPPSLTGHSMVYDSARKVTVLFGGREYTGFSNRTWEWDGFSWTLRQSLHSPPRLSKLGMVFDRARNRTVVFGGTKYTDAAGSEASPSDETWEWDGYDWSRANPTLRPLPRSSPSMCFDTIRQETLMLGGENPALSSADKQLLWAWNGTNWSRRSTLPLASPQEVYAGNAMAFDEFRGVAALFGPFFDSTNPVWEWDGTFWNRAVSGPNDLSIPDSQHYRSAFWDPYRRKIGVVGGSAGGLVLQNSAMYWDGKRFFGEDPSIVDEITGISKTGVEAIPLEADGCAFDQERRAVVWFDTERTFLAGLRFTREMHFKGKPAVIRLPYLAAQTNGGSILLTAIAAGAQPLNYQWLKNGVPLIDGGSVSGSTKPNLILTKVSASESALYTVFVANACGNTTSHALELITADSPPVPLLFASVVPGPTGLLLINLAWLSRSGKTVLEFSDDLIDWQPVSPQPADNTFSELSSGPRRFFRLRAL